MDTEKAGCHLQNSKMTKKESSYSTEYTLPGLRYANVVKVIAFVDGIFSLILWLTGGFSEYFIDNIIHFHILQSVFDLAVLAALKTILIFVILDFLEKFSMAEIEEPYNRQISKKKNTTHAVFIIFLLLSMAYTITKGGLILNAVLNDPNYQTMHLTFNILTISATVFGIIEFLLAIASFAFMRRLKLCRIKHMYNDNGQEVDEEGKVVQKSTNLRRLASLAKEEVTLLVLGCLCLLASSASTMVAPLLFGQVVDAAQKSMADLNRTILILFGVYAAGSVASMFRAWTFTIAGQRVVARLRSRLFAKIIIQDIAFFDVTRTGELTNRLSADTGVVQNAVTVNLSMLMRNLLQVFGSIVLMFVINPALSGVLLAVVPIVSIGAVQYGIFVKKKQKEFQDCLADASTVAEECISSARTVRMFSSEKASIKDYHGKVHLSYLVGRTLAIASGAFQGVIGMAGYGAIVLVLWYGGKLVFEKHITSGVLFSFMLYTLQVAIAFATLSSLYGDFMKAVGASIRIFELLDRVPEVPCEGGDKPIDFDGSIRFHDVRFTYPSRADSEVLKGVSFSVQPGQMVALVGPSGGGKSTIVSLIERFYDPNSGTIDVGSYELKFLDPEWLHTKISMVGQEPVLFASSIKDNIAYGREASLEEVEEAAKQANAHDFIMSFDDGYNTLVGERGIRLSGGQKQRVAIARALIMNPDILLLDEATSALDAESEHLVQEAIDNAMRNRTVLVIAHRLSTVKHASKVLVVDKGQVVEQGTHDELLNHNGVYKKLVLRQLMAGTLDAKDGKSSLEESEETAGVADVD